MGRAVDPPTRTEHSLADLLATGHHSPLPDPSSYLSSRWPEDNVLTPYPPQRFDGLVRQSIGVDELLGIFHELQPIWGPFEAQDAHRGVFNWEVRCSAKDGDFTIDIPTAWDELGTGGRAKRLLGERSDALARSFAARGLTRHLRPAAEILSTSAGFVVAKKDRPKGEFPLTFGRGGLLVNVTPLQPSWSFSLSLEKTAELLTEMVAAIAYHYEPEKDGGTSPSDLYVNDGDFTASREEDGRWKVRLRTLRGTEPGIAPELFLCHLIQLCAYEDFSIGRGITGLPVLVSDPSIAFAGFERGLELNARDRGADESRARTRCREMIDSFSRSRWGHCYRPWAELYAQGSLPPGFGHDRRHHWWQLSSLLEKVEMLRLGCGGSDATGELAAHEEMLRALTAAVGSRATSSPETFFVHEATREEIRSMLLTLDQRDEARGAGQRATPPSPEAHGAKHTQDLRVADRTDKMLAAIDRHFPFRTRSEFLDRVAGARALAERGVLFHFGSPLGDDEEGTRDSLSLSAPARRAEQRTVVNHEMISARPIPGNQQELSLTLFPSFEAFMDGALFDDGYGFYSKSVQIGRQGHFTTHPERFSPHYGRWIAHQVVSIWSLIEQKGNVEGPFFVVEFGAGTGRLARDVLDAIHAGDAPAPFQRLASRLVYVIYEQSETLRAQQRDLLGADARISPGDARRPAECLRRDFPEGLVGLVLSNELLDAFGVHKLYAASPGHAEAALVVPHLEQGLEAEWPGPLADSIRATDARLRRLFPQFGKPAHRLLDALCLRDFLRAAHEHPERDRLLAGLWCEETYVDARRLPELASHLDTNQSDYESAWGADQHGALVLYVNCHAERYIQQVGQCLKQGAVLTIDYGDTTTGLIQAVRSGHFAFRVYRDTPLGTPTQNDPLAFPGTVDLTADVNFSALSRAGEAVGLRVLRFAHERVLAGADQDALQKQANDAATRSFLYAPVFKMLLLGRGL